VIDQGINLDDGMRMIRRAVEQRPDDGYIVDSLGWAHYRIKEYDEAVKQLERAVELKPQDPTSTTISATPIGKWGARSRRPSNGRMRAILPLSRTT